MSRVTPSDLAAEEAVLGCMMLSRGAMIDTARLEPADFWKPEHGRIFTAARTIWDRGEGVDPVTLAAELGPTIRREELFRIQAGTPSSANVRAYIAVVVRHSMRRKALRLAAAVTDHALDGADEELLDLLVEAPEALRLAEGSIEEAQTMADVRAGSTEYAWLIPGLLERKDRVLFTGSEGFGKSTLLRQLSVCAAMGLHPFSLAYCRPAKVLVIDFENTPRQNSREYGKIGNMIDRWPERWDESRWRLISGVASVDLSSPRGQVWLESQIDHHRPDFITLGPLYKAYQGGPDRKKDSEETAGLVVAALDGLRQRYDVAFAMEGHSPHGERGDRAGGRMRGSSLWQAWPEFVFSLEDASDKLTRPGAYLRRARGPRDRERNWPDVIFQGRAAEFPWTSEDTPPSPPTPGAPALDDSF